LIHLLLNPATHQLLLLEAPPPAVSLPLKHTQSLVDQVTTETDPQPASLIQHYPVEPNRRLGDDGSEVDYIGPITFPRENLPVGVNGVAIETMPTLLPLAVLAYFDQTNGVTAYHLKFQFGT
jgi:hypothetical protein